MDDHLDYDRIERAIRYLETHAADQPRLADVAAELGLSEAHFHRMFHRWAGVTPKDFVQFLTLGRAKQLLAHAHSVMDASLEVGLSGSGRLHDLFVTIEALTPGEYKRGGEGVSIAWDTHDTPLGPALFAVTERGLCGLAFLGAEGLEGALADLKARWPNAGFRQDAGAIAPYAAEVGARMQGAPARPLALLLKGTPFQLKVWEALLAVPEGRVMSYQHLAASAGVPGASRAVGTAMGANPIGYLIPCHRVIRAGGEIGEYRWGSTRKRVLLAIEGARSVLSPSA
jgi:AraC family transcriptional regulator of adaptative response/methylated-DNA-[protein]-cysteine methyltransferase